MQLRQRLREKNLLKDNSWLAENTLCTPRLRWLHLRGQSGPQEFLGHPDVYRLHHTFVPNTSQASIRMTFSPKNIILTQPPCQSPFVHWPHF